MDVFAIVKRKRITEDQKRLIIADNKSVNRARESVIQNYFKHTSWDEQLADSMIRNGHRLDRENIEHYDMFHLVIYHCRDPKIATAKIKWLIKNNAPIDIIKTVFLLAISSSNKSGEWCEYILMEIMKSHEIIEKLDNLNTDIREEYQNLNFCFELQSLENIIYLDTIFKCNYDVMKMDIEITRKFSQKFLNNRDVLIYFMEKSSNALTVMCSDLLNEHQKSIPFLYKSVVENAIDNIDILYNFGFQDDDNIDYFWNHCLWHILFLPHSNVYPTTKRILIYGLVSGKFHSLPTGLIKIHKLEVNDLMNYIDFKIIDSVNYGNAHCNTNKYDIDDNLAKHFVTGLAPFIDLSHMFPEDFDDVEMKEKIIKMTRRNGYEDYTLERCSRIKRDIYEFLRNLGIVMIDNSIDNSIDNLKDNLDDKIIAEPDNRTTISKARRRIAGKPGTKRKVIKVRKV